MSAGIHKLDFSASDDVRTPEKTRVETLTIGNAKVARLTAQAGWVWKECIAPVTGTDSCQVRHLGVVHSGSLLVQHEDGSEETITKGDIYECIPGHQAKVIGDEPCVMIEFDASTAGDYAK